MFGFGKKGTGGGGGDKKALTDVNRSVTGKIVDSTFVVGDNALRSEALDSR